MASGYGARQRKVSQDVLQRFDGNKDGAVSLYELASAYKKMGVRSPVQHAYAAILLADEDGDGVIDKEREVASVAAYLRQPSYGA